MATKEITNLTTYETRKSVKPFKDYTHRTRAVLNIITNYSPVGTNVDLPCIEFHTFVPPKINLSPVLDAGADTNKDVYTTTVLNTGSHAGGDTIVGISAS